MSTHRRYESPVGRILYDSDGGWDFEQLGAGRYGSTWRVSDKSGKKEWALKIFDQVDEDQAKESRKAETDTLRKLKGAGGHVPVCHSIGTYFEKGDGSLISRSMPAFAMDFVAGETLEDVIKHKVLTGGAFLLNGKQALEVMEKVCEAVAACHLPTGGEGCVHRDLAPKNIMVHIPKTDNRSHAFVSNAVIVDWGQAPRSDLHSTPAAKGTPLYAAPELLRAQPTKKGGRGEPLVFELPTVDVWSLGAIAYFVRTGKHPSLPAYSSLSDEEKFLKWAEHKEQHPISLPDDCNNDNYDKYLNEFIRCCTEKDYKERPQNASKAREYLDARKHLNQSKTVPPEKTPSLGVISEVTPVLPPEPLSTDVWVAQYKLYRGDKPYSDKTSDLLVVGSSRESCAIATYEYNKRTYIAHRAGDVLDVKDKGVWFNEKRKEAVWHTVEVVDFIDNVNPTDLTGWFAGCRRLKEIRHIDRLDTSAVQSFAHMFYNCESLSSLNLSSFKTSNAVAMNHMFFGCSSLTSLDLSSLNTSNVTDMSYMFYYCHSLATLNLSSFDTSNVTDMSYMFYGCHSLTSLDLFSFDTSNVANMGHMFYRCGSLVALDLSSFDTSNVTDMSYMFNLCVSLRSLDISGFNAPQAKDLTGMFEACLKLRRIEGKSFSHSKEAKTTDMYKDCRMLGRGAVAAIGYKVADVFILVFDFLEMVFEMVMVIAGGYYLLSGIFLFLNYCLIPLSPISIPDSVVNFVQISFWVSLFASGISMIAVLFWPIPALCDLLSGYRVYGRDGSKKRRNWPSLVNIH